MVSQITAFHQTTDGRVETLWVRPEGRDPGTVLVLLHEGLGCIDLWRDFPQRLASRSGFGVFAYSRVGYGRSDPCTLPRPLTYMHHEAENILPQVLESLEAESVILVGHSDGASIAAIHAGGTPDPRLSGLILMGPHFFAEPVSIRSIAEAKTAYETGTLREGLAKYHGDNVDCAFRGWNDAWLDPEFRHWNLTGFLPNIRVPVLFIQGKEDQYGTLRQLAALKRHLPSSPDSRVIGQSRHSPHLDQPGETLETMDHFLKHARAG
ncbi:MAG: alpha/beta hydrolase [Gammaproteobacteria bacterium]|nr:alpha/beta hydrolase [Gammaproteobacteria bacterium]